MRSFEGDVCFTISEVSPCEHGLRGMFGPDSSASPEPADGLICLLSMLEPLLCRRGRVVVPLMNGYMVVFVCRGPGRQSSGLFLLLLLLVTLREHTDVPLQPCIRRVDGDH